MKIIISDHAEERIKTYRLNKDLIIETIKKPDEVIKGYNKRLIAHKLLNKYVLRVVYEKHEDEIIVVTVYPVEKERYLGIKK